jgi:DNA-binding MarR family transcriptional regulator
MSIHIMNAVWQHGPRDTSARMLLLAIADCANDQGEAFPSVALLGEKSCMSKSTVLRTLQALETAGWFAVRRRTVQWDGDTHPRGNLYMVTLEKLRLQPPKQAEVRTPRGVTVTPQAADRAEALVEEREVSKAASRSVRMTPQVAACEVSKTALRGVKSEHPPTPPLVGEPSGTVTTTPLPPTSGGIDTGSSDGETQATIAELRTKRAAVRMGGDEWFRLSCELKTLLDRAAPQPVLVATGTDPPLTPGRRRRRLTQAMLAARVGS